MKNIIKFALSLFFLCLLPATASAAEVTYYHTDALGTPLAMTDSEGKVVWKGDYYPFGEEYQLEEKPDKNKRLFTGKEKDKESGLHYFGARYMDEVSGRFISPDPVTPVDPQTSATNTVLLGNPLRLNRYVYGLNNPYRYIDPDGEIAVESEEYKTFKTEIRESIKNTTSTAVNLAVALGGLMVDAPGYRVPRVRLRHFTNSKGIKGIRSNGIIRAGDKNRVYSINAKGKPGSPRDIETTLGIKRGRGNNFIDFDAQPNEYQTIKNPKTGAIENIFKGDVDLTGRNPTYHKNR